MSIWGMTSLERRPVLLAVLCAAALQTGLASAQIRHAGSATPNAMAAANPALTSSTPAAAGGTSTQVAQSVSTTSGATGTSTVQQGPADGLGGGVVIRSRQQ